MFGTYRLYEISSWGFIIVSPPTTFSCRDDDNFRLFRCLVQKS